MDRRKVRKEHERNKTELSTVKEVRETKPGHRTLHSIHSNPSLDMSIESHRSKFARHKAYDSFKSVMDSKLPSRSHSRKVKPLKMVLDPHISLKLEDR